MKFDTHSPTNRFITSAEQSISVMWIMKPQLSLNEWIFSIAELLLR
jgi:hypothetical protein